MAVYGHSASLSINIKSKQFQQEPLRVIMQYSGHKSGLFSVLSSEATAAVVCTAVFCVVHVYHSGLILLHFFQMTPTLMNKL